MAIYAFMPKSAFHYELTKLDENGMPLSEPYTLRKRDGKGAWTCTCPAGVHRRKCKHPGMLHAWRARPDGQRIGYVFDASNGTYYQLMPTEEEVAAALERMVSSSDSESVSETPPETKTKRLVDYRGIKD